MYPEPTKMLEKKKKTSTVFMLWPNKAIATPPPPTKKNRTLSFLLFSGSQMAEQLGNQAINQKVGSSIPGRAK